MSFVCFVDQILSQKMSDYTLIVIYCAQTDLFTIAGDGLLPQTGPGLAPGPQPGMGIFAMMGEKHRITPARQD